MDNITITGSPIIVIPLFLIVLGVAYWIGYLVGRVRTLDPYRERFARPQPSPRGAVIFGGALVVLAGLLLSPMVSGGFHGPSDGPGVMVLLGGVVFLGLGAAYLARGIRELRQL